MAKLSANGTEIARYVRIGHGCEGVLRSRTELSIRSNGRVLRKHTAVIHDPYNPNGYRLVSQGWKLWQRFPKDVPTLEQIDKDYGVFGFVRQGVDTRN